MVRRLPRTDLKVLGLPKQVMIKPNLKMNCSGKGFKLVKKGIILVKYHIEPHGIRTLSGEAYHEITRLHLHY